MDREGLAEIARRHGIRLVLRFGSTVAGRIHAGSDIDLGVLFDRMPPTWEEEAALLSDLQELQQDREIDIAILNRADPLFLKQVTQQCELLFGEPRDLYELKIYAFKRYQDHRRYLPLEKKYVERVLAATVK
ncbi:MAG TPA: nucleotidyltransferase domain-containing protein [Thermoanaerobaculia bacterium]|nr:nucleotidyltransferase domain-containing protein [Thermoanaerobaculia bacterium]